MGTMRLLVKNRKTFPVLMLRKSLSQWTIYVPRGLETYMIHIQVENIRGRISMQGILNASENCFSDMTQDLGLLESERMTMLQV